MRICAAALIVASTLQQPPAAADLLERAGAYVEQLRQQLGLVIADEKYDQHAGLMARRIKSEMLFVWLEDERFWTAIRNVLAVDGRNVPDSRQRLDRILMEGSPETYAQLQRVGEEGARFNIGVVTRTTNSPTLVLQFLLPETQPRFAFTLVGTEQIRHVRASVVRFAERRAPTEIAYNFGPILSSGRIWLRDSDGAVLRTELDLSADSGLKAFVRVDFAPDPRLGMLAPARMEERYEVPDRPRTTCIAKYSHYRRFETSARLVAPK